LRDISASINLRTELGEHWVVLSGLGASRLLGPAADSPYVAKTGNW
jgi:outer membrane scaffolding protein for murein synthesis (MipA/OmpV family)